jgi:hypothetical protein
MAALPKPCDPMSPSFSSKAIALRTCASCGRPAAQRRCSVDDVRLRSILQRHSTPEVQDWFEKFGIATSDVPVRTPTSPELGVLSRLCLPVRWHGVTYGYLWLLDEHGGIDESRMPAAEALAERAGALMANWHAPGRSSRSRWRTSCRPTPKPSVGPQRPSMSATCRRARRPGRGRRAAAGFDRSGTPRADEPVAPAAVGPGCER